MHRWGEQVWSMRYKIEYFARVFNGYFKLILECTIYKIKGLEVYDWLWVMRGRLNDFTIKMQDLWGVQHVNSRVWIYASIVIGYQIEW